MNYILNLTKSNKRGFNLKKTKKILILKISAIGDSILCLPMIKVLKEKTKTEIVVICSNENKNVFEGQPFIDKVIVSNFTGKNPIKMFQNLKMMKKEKADIIIDTSQSANFSAMVSYLYSNYNIGIANINETRNKIYDGLIVSDANTHVIYKYFNALDILEIPYSEKDLKLIPLKYSKKENDKVVKLLKNRKDIVIIHPCNIFPYKVWNKNNFVEIIEYLIKNKKNIVIIGSPNEEELVGELVKSVKKRYLQNILDLSGQINIGELIALMTHAKLFLGNDGGPMHMAACMGVPTIGLFGHETPLRYAPFSDKSIALYSKYHCSPCNKAYLSQWPDCDDPKCVNAITVKEVEKAIDDLVNYPTINDGASDFIDTSCLSN